MRLTRFGQRGRRIIRATVGAVFTAIGVWLMVTTPPDAYGIFTYFPVEAVPFIIGMALLLLGAAILASAVPAPPGRGGGPGKSRGTRRRG